MRSSSHNHWRNKIILYIHSNLDLTAKCHIKENWKKIKQTHNKRGNRDKKEIQLFCKCS